MSYAEKQFVNSLTFKGFIATAKTPGGLDAVIMENDRNINRIYYSLEINGKLMFTRGTIGKCLEVINKH
jgi:hypothetical protein